jgi:hypothetical protein
MTSEKYTKIDYKMPAIPDYEGHIVAKPKHSIPALSTINHRTNVTFSEALVFV